MVARVKFKDNPNPHGGSTEPEVKVVTAVAGWWKGLHTTVFRTPYKPKSPNFAGCRGPIFRVTPTGLINLGIDPRVPVYVCGHQVDMN